MNNIVNIEEYKQKKSKEILSKYVFLRPFDFDNLRYNNKVKKNGVSFTISAYMSPYDGKNLIFDVYNKDCELIKVFMVTEEEYCLVSNLDYHIWNKIDGDNVDNPVDKKQNYFEPGKDGIVDERDLLPCWDKINKNRFTMIEREGYDLYIKVINDFIDKTNEKLKDAYNKTISKK